MRGGGVEALGFRVTALANPSGKRLPAGAAPRFHLRLAFPAARRTKAPAAATSGPAESLEGYKRLDDFTDWFLSKGGKLHSGLYLCRSAIAGYGLKFTSRPDETEGSLVEVPSSLRIDAAIAESSPVSGLWRWAYTGGEAAPGGPATRPWQPPDCRELLEQCKLMGADPMGPLRQESVRIALFLLAESCNPSSDWQPYLQMLPTIDEMKGHAAFWGTDELMGFDDVALAHCALLDQATAEGIFRHYVVPGFPSCCGSTPSKEQLQWALAVAESRVLYGDFYGSGSQSGYCALLPMIDMVNHASVGLVNGEDAEARGRHANCAVRVEGGCARLLPIAERSLGKGSELLHAYRSYAPEWDGVMPAHVSLLSYGFLEDDGPSLIKAHTMFPQSPHGQRMREGLSNEVKNAFPWWRSAIASVKRCEASCSRTVRELGRGELQGNDLLFAQYKLGQTLAVAFEGIQNLERKKGGEVPHEIVELGKQGYNSIDPGVRFFWRSVLDHRQGKVVRHGCADLPHVPLSRAWVDCLGDGRADSVQAPRKKIEVVAAEFEEVEETLETNGRVPSKALVSMEDLLGLLGDPEIASVLARPQTQAALKRCSLGESSLASDPDLKEVVEAMQRKLRR